MPTIKPGSFQSPNTVGSIGRGTVATRIPHVASTACCCPVCSGLQCLDRTRFFSGQLLSEADLNNEQSYWLAKSRLHNRYLVGWGVVCGLQVVCGDCDGWVKVRSGYAIDPCGNDVIVCEDQNFNVAKAIRDCCTPARQPAANCSPLRYNPSPNCTGTTQKWCITLQYQEQPSRLVTPLNNSASQSSSCGCGCSNGNGNGSGNSSSSSSQSCKTSSTTKTSSTVPAGACEPTRIVEGFQLGVVSAEEFVSANQIVGNKVSNFDNSGAYSSFGVNSPDPGSLTYNIEQCIFGIVLLLEQKPDITDSTLPQIAYQNTCDYLRAATNFFAKSSNITHCRILDALSAITVPSNQDIGTYVGIVAEITRILSLSVLDCLCFSLLPPCPINPCDNRIVLACVTVQDGSIVDICHFTGRKQLITLHTLGYWLGPLGLDRLRTEIGRILTLICCNEERQLGGFGFNANNMVYDKEMMTTAGFTSGAAVNRVAAHYISQTMGASVINAVSPGARAVDLRPFVNMNAETVQAHLKEQGFSNVRTQAVSEDTSWNSGAVSSSAMFAPAAVSPDQPVTMYTKGNLAIGFDVVDPTTAKIQDLQDQVTALQNQLGQFNANRVAADKQQAKKPPSGKA
jgi:hypothetical protein